MLEILLIIYISRKIGAIAEKKGHKRRPNVIFFIVMWIAGELSGAMIGAFFSKGNLGITYLMAIVGAVLGTVLAFNVVQKLEDKNDSDYIIIDGDK